MPARTDRRLLAAAGTAVGCYIRLSQNSADSDGGQGLQEAPLVMPAPGQRPGPPAPVDAARAAGTGHGLPAAPVTVQEPEPRRQPGRRPAAGIGEGRIGHGPIPVRKQSSLGLSSRTRCSFAQWGGAPRTFPVTWSSGGVAGGRRPAGPPGRAGLASPRLVVGRPLSPSSN